MASKTKPTGGRAATPKPAARKSSAIKPARAAKAPKPDQRIDATAPTSKLDILAGALRAEEGATLDALMAATHWQRHSVRGALAGALKKRGHAIVSEKVDGVRRYRIEAEA